MSTSGDRSQAASMQNADAQQDRQYQPAGGRGQRAQMQAGRGYAARGPGRGGRGGGPGRQYGSQDVREGGRGEMRRPQMYPAQQQQRQQPRQGPQLNSGDRQASEAFPQLSGSRPASLAPSSTGSSPKAVGSQVSPTLAAPPLASAWGAPGGASLAAKLASKGKSTQQPGAAGSTASSSGTGAGVAMQRLGSVSSSRDGPQRPEPPAERPAVSPESVTQGTPAAADGGGGNSPAIAAEPSGQTEQEAPAAAAEPSVQPQPEAAAGAGTAAQPGALPDSAAAAQPPDVAQVQPQQTEPPAQQQQQPQQQQQQQSKPQPSPLQRQQQQPPSQLPPAAPTEAAPALQPSASQRGNPATHEVVAATNSADVASETSGSAAAVTADVPTAQPNAARSAGSDHFATDNGRAASGNAAAQHRPPQQEVRHQQQYAQHPNPQYQQQQPHQFNGRRRHQQPFGPPGNHQQQQEHQQLFPPGLQQQQQRYGQPFYQQPQQSWQYMTPQQAYYWQQQQQQQPQHSHAMGVPVGYGPPPDGRSGYGRSGIMFPPPISGAVPPVVSQLQQQYLDDQGRVVIPRPPPLNPVAADAPPSHRLPQQYQDPQQSGASMGFPVDGIGFPAVSYPAVSQQPGWAPGPMPQPYTQPQQPEHMQQPAQQAPVAQSSAQQQPAAEPQQAPPAQQQQPSVQLPPPSPQRQQPPPAAILTFGDFGEDEVQADSDARSFGGSEAAALSPTSSVQQPLPWHQPPRQSEAAPSPGEARPASAAEQPPGGTSPPAAMLTLEEVEHRHSAAPAQPAAEAAAPPPPQQQPQGAEPAAAGVDADVRGGQEGQRAEPPPAGEAQQQEQQLRRQSPQQQAQRSVSRTQSQASISSQTEAQEAARRALEGLSLPSSGSLQRQLSQPGTPSRQPRTPAAEAQAAQPEGQQEAGAAAAPDVLPKPEAPQAPLSWADRLKQKAAPRPQPQPQAQPPLAQPRAVQSRPAQQQQPPPQQQQQQGRTQPLQQRLQQQQVPPVKPPLPGPQQHSQQQQRQPQQPQQQADGQPRRAPPQPQGHQQAAQGQQGRGHSQPPSRRASPPPRILEVPRVASGGVPPAPQQAVTPQQQKPQQPKPQQPQHQAPAAAAAATPQVNGAAPEAAAAQAAQPEALVKPQAAAAPAAAAGAAAVADSAPAASTNGVPAQPPSDAPKDQSAEADAVRQVAEGLPAVEPPKLDAAIQAPEAAATAEGDTDATEPTAAEPSLGTEAVDKDIAGAFLPAEAAQEEPAPEVPDEEPRQPAVPASPEAHRALAELAGRAPPGRPRRMEPRGLTNPGNLCFMNATLQALMGATCFCDFLELLTRAQPLLDAKAAPTLSALAAFAAEFTPVEAPSTASASAASKGSMTQLGSGKRAPAGQATVAAGPAPASPPPKLGAWGKGAPGGTPASVLGSRPLLPVMLMDTVNAFAPAGHRPVPTAAPRGRSSFAAAAYAKQDQEDAQEFLQYLLDHAHLELVAVQQRAAVAEGQDGSPDGAGAAAGSGVISGSPPGGGPWATVGKRNKAATLRGEEDVQGGSSLVSAMLFGSTRSAVTATSMKPSITLAPFTQLGLNISPPGVRSVGDALEEFTHAEIIPDYRVKDGQAPVEASKAVKLSKLPPLLVVHMQRFAYDAAGFTKLHKPVHFAEALNLTKRWMADSSPDYRGAEYTLVATVSHHGKNPNAGHYTADVKQPDGRWLRFDDATVTSVPLSMVLNDQAYLLFYSKAR